MVGIQIVVPDDGVLKCRNMKEYIKHQCVYIECVMHLLSSTHLKKINGTKLKK
jgi:hypothetical protein